MGAEISLFSLKMTGDMLKFQQFLDTPRFKNALERNVRKATIKNCLLLMKVAKEKIKSGNFAHNAMLTEQLKKSDLPLINEKNLFDAINYELKSAFQAEIGIFGSARSTGGVKSAPTSMQKVVELMHTGYMIKVTDKMRKAIAAYLGSQRTKKGNLTGRAKFGLKVLGGMQGHSTHIWRVPPRPFLTEAWGNEEVKREVQFTWRESLEQTWRDCGAKDGEDKDK